MKRNAHDCLYFLTGGQCRILRVSGRAFQLLTGTRYLQRDFDTRSHGAGNRYHLLLRHRRRERSSSESYHELTYCPELMKRYLKSAIETTHGLHAKAFDRELEKEALYLQISRPITDKRTCKVCDLSSPLLYHGAVGCVRSVKDCPTAYRLRLVP